MKSPLVSICIPCYNCEKYIKDTLISAINQTYKNIEIVIVDNNSTDNSWEIIKKFKEKYISKVKIKTYKNNKNIGMTPNWNRCIKLAKGDYISFFHADDIYNKNLIKQSVDLINRFKKVKLIVYTTHTFKKKDENMGVSKNS